MVHTLVSLYPSTETSFETNGLGSLGEAASCEVTEAANGSFELEMVYPVTGKHYKELSNRSIIFAKPNPVDPPQPFRIYEISRPMNGLVVYFAAHISYDLSGYPVKPFSAENVGSAMSGLKSYSINSHPFTFWTDKNVDSKFVIETPMPIKSVLGGIQGSILDLYGGEYKFDRFSVRLYMHRGQDHGVTIRYGKNLTDLKQEENCSNVYTGVLPYWYGQQDNEKILVQLQELVVPTGGSYNFINILTLDLSSEFQAPPTESELRDRTQKYIKNNKIGIPKVSLTVSFAQLEQTEEYKHLALLERVELFDSVNVEFPEMGVSSKSKVCQTVYDVLKGRYSSVTLGEIRTSISDTIIQQGEHVNQVVDQITDNIDQKVDDINEKIYSTEEILRKEVEDATNWIINGKGYMVAVKDKDGNWVEICSLDTPNINEAVNVWRWNNGGFGHSSNGYNGPYETAITQDGHIVADFITTGTLTATLIQAGVLKSVDKDETFYLDLENGILRMKATELSIKGKTVDEISKGAADDAAQYAIDEAERMADNAAQYAIGEAERIAKDEAQYAVDSQTQAEIFNKLTDNGKTQGIFMKNGKIYINATYMVSGVIADEKRMNSWDLNNGLLVANNIIATGTFTCGSSTKYLYLNDQAQMKGYQNGSPVGYIDYSATVWDSTAGKTLYGLQLQADGTVRISTPSISVMNSSDVNVTTYKAITGTITQGLVSGITTSGTDILSYTYGYLALGFTDGLLTSYSIA